MPSALGGPAPLARRPRIDWTNTGFIVGAHAAGIWGLLHLCLVRFSWATLALAGVWYLLSGLSITGGYHRLLSHATYRASAVLRFFYLAFGAASFQNAALLWAADHRAHHAHTDREGDPYNIRRGFFWAHIGWVLCKLDRPRDLSRVRDLERDALVRWQHRWYVPLGLAVGFFLPGAIAATWGDALGGFLVAGWLRLVLQWHATFTINSLAHMVGSQNYSTGNSARDSSLIALISFGEGYHNYHHRFQSDYRNGVRWYHLDVTKWWIFALSKLGFASDLRRVSPERILAARALVRQGGDPSAADL